MTLFLRLRSQQAGVAALEFALILPVLLLLLLGVLEFGVYFVKSQFVQRTVSGIANSVQLNALDSVNIKNTATSSGGTMVTYDDSANAYFCAKAYADLASAQAGMCTHGEWFLDKPVGVTGNTYYVAIQASVQQNSITPMFASLLPPMKATAVVQVGAAVASQDHGIALLDTVGTGTWVVPDGVTKLKATIIGAGGGANGSSNSGGGGTGAVIIVYLKNLTPGSAVAYTVGAGAASDSSLVAKNGGSTAFAGITAGGGGGSNNGGTRGAGGTSAPGQVASSGNISSIAYFNGVNGSSYNAFPPNFYLSYGRGGGIDWGNTSTSGYLDGTKGAVIIEW